MAADWSALDSGVVPHWRDCAAVGKTQPVWVVIPSIDRPETLCDTTLRLCRRHGIQMHRVAVFVTPGHVAGQSETEEARYKRTLAARGFGRVRIVMGGSGLERQMARARAWVGLNGYMVTMSDRVSDYKEGYYLGGASDRVCLRSLPLGSLPRIIQHGYQLLQSGGFAAWSVSPSHVTFHLRPDRLSR